VKWRTAAEERQGQQERYFDSLRLELYIAKWGMREVLNDMLRSGQVRDAVQPGGVAGCGRRPRPPRPARGHPSFHALSLPEVAAVCGRSKPTASPPPRRPPPPPRHTHTPRGVQGAPMSAPPPAWGLQLQQQCWER
jgi:hypothetical protein